MHRERDRYSGIAIATDVDVGLATAIDIANVILRKGRHAET